jgi:DNA repair protein RecN (Recombination protein N)
MLRSLYVRDYALIDELQVEFGSGLNVLTGETGAGKSILIGALSMILGERASTDSVRSGAKKAVIEGTFDEAGTPRIGELLDANEIDPLPGGAGQIILRRQITDRQSRGFVNDTPATLDVMRAVAAELIDLHGQHEHQSLLKTEKHLQLLDHFGSLGDLRRTYQQHHDRVAALVEERDELTARRERLEEKRQLYEFQIEEIDEVAPEEGEDERLDAERRRLSNAEHLFEATQELYRRLYEAEDAINDRLVVARNELQDLARIDDAFTEQLDEIESAQISVAEAASFLQDYGARIEFDPGRLSEIRERVQELERLKRKYGGSLEAVLDHRAKIGEEHELAADVEGALGDLSDKIEAAQRALTEAARRLSEKRKEVATRIEEAILEELAKLGMPESRFEVRFTREEREDGWILPEDDQDGNARHAAFQRGMDRAEFYISTNVGEKLRPLREVASGGEISRIMLALKTILAKSERLPILVFDEIDIGISGGIARKVGRSMHDLASYHQIIAITHLPQIAALGDEHFRVAKHVEEGRTVTGIERLGEDEQAAQVATLIGGEDVTGAALENARELMKPAGDGAASDGAARANAPAGEG